MSFYVSFSITEPFPTTVPTEHVQAALLQNPNVETELAALYSAALTLIDSGAAGESGGSQQFDVTLAGHKAEGERIVLNLNLLGGGPLPPSPEPVVGTEPTGIGATPVADNEQNQQDQQTSEESTPVVPQQDQQDQTA